MLCLCFNMISYSQNVAIVLNAKLANEPVQIERLTLILQDTAIILNDRSPKRAKSWQMNVYERKAHAQFGRGRRQST